MREREGGSAVGLEQAAGCGAYIGLGHRHAVTPGGGPGGAAGHPALYYDGWQHHVFRRVLPGQALLVTREGGFHRAAPPCLTPRYTPLPKPILTIGPLKKIRGLARGAGPCGCPPGPEKLFGECFYI